MTHPLYNKKSMGALIYSFISRYLSSAPRPNRVMETHENPEQSKCDGPTQWHLNRLEELLDFLEIPRI